MGARILMIASSSQVTESILQASEPAFRPSAIPASFPEPYPSTPCPTQQFLPSKNWQTPSPPNHSTNKI